jgi:site-specific recombinase XerD
MELRALRRLQREAPQSEFVFISERGAPFSTAGSAKLMERARAEAGIKFGTVSAAAVAHGMPRHANQRQGRDK